MAQVFKLTDDTATVDFIGGTVVYWRFEGWQTRTATNLTWETIDLASTASDTAIRTEVAKIDELLDQARRYHIDQNENNPVWLYWQSDGENAKRALIYDGNVELLTENRWSPMLNASGASLRLALQRGPLWENTTPGTVTAGSINFLGGTVIIGNDTGTAPQRIGELLVEASGTEALNYVEEMWLGIRKTRTGVAGFIPVWDCALGTEVAAVNTFSTADAGAYGGTVMYCDFTSGVGGTQTALNNRFVIYWNDVASANYDDIIGQYLLLARVKLSDSGVVRMQTKHGWGDNDAYKTVVSDTYLDTSDDSNLNGNFRLKPIGIVRIPPTGNRGGKAGVDDNIAFYRIEVAAEQVDGSPAISWDCFILVPAEHIMTALNKDSILAGNGISYAYDFHAFTAEDNTQYCVTEAVGQGYISSEYSFDNWFYPVGGGVMVIAGQKTTSQLTLEGDITMTLYPRWQSFRDT